MKSSKIAICKNLEPQNFALYKVLNLNVRQFYVYRSFQAKVGLLHQCTILSSKFWSSYKLELTGRSVKCSPWTTHIHLFQSVYNYLSVCRHNVSPRFHHHCLSQLYLLIFKPPLQEHINFMRKCIYIATTNFNVSIYYHVTLINKYMSTMHFTSQLENQVTDWIQFFAVTNLHNNIPISGSITILRCASFLFSWSHITPRCDFLRLMMRILNIT